MSGIAGGARRLHHRRLARLPGRDGFPLGRQWIGAEEQLRGVLGLILLGRDADEMGGWQVGVRQIDIGRRAGRRQLGELVLRIGIEPAAVFLQRGFGFRLRSQS